MTNRAAGGVLSECGKPDKRTVNVTFNCNCKGGKRTTQPVYVGARTCTVSVGESRREDC